MVCKNSKLYDVVTLDIVGLHYGCFFFDLPPSTGATDSARPSTIWMCSWWSQRVFVCRPDPVAWTRTEQFRIRRSKYKIAIERNKSSWFVYGFRCEQQHQLWQETWDTGSSSKAGDVSMLLSTLLDRTEQLQNLFPAKLLFGKPATWHASRRRLRGASIGQSGSPDQLYGLGSSVNQLGQMVKPRVSKAWMPLSTSKFGDQHFRILTMSTSYSPHDYDYADLATMTIKRMCI